MNRIACVIAICVVAGLVFGQPPCPDQVFLPLSSAIDSSQITVDPVSGNPLLLGVIRAIVGRPARIVGRACDQDPNDTLTVWILPDGPSLTLDPNGVYTHTITPTSPGATYVHVGATDGIATRQGTWVIRARANNPPTLCGGIVQ